MKQYTDTTLQGIEERLLELQIESVGDNVMHFKDGSFLEFEIVITKYGEAIQYTLFKDVPVKNNWNKTASDIVIPNEIILVRYQDGSTDLIFYDGLRLPNFTHWMNVPSFP